MSINQIIYYAGLGLLALGAVGGALSALFLGLASKHLKDQLEVEYGKPRHS